MCTPEARTKQPAKSLCMRYERSLHKLESDLSSMVTVDGGMFAVRRSLYALAEDTVSTTS